VTVLFVLVIKGRDSKRRGSESMSGGHREPRLTEHRSARVESLTLRQRITVILI